MAEIVEWMERQEIFAKFIAERVAAGWIPLTQYPKEACNFEVRDSNGNLDTYVKTWVEWDGKVHYKKQKSKPREF